MRSLKHVNQLQYETPQFITNICNHLRKSIKTYATQNSEIYKTRNKTISKADLQDKSKWYVNSIPFAEASTGGSTTATKFYYRRWHGIYEQIEGTCHYKAIAEEFNIKDHPHILYLMMDLPHIGQNLVDVIKTNNVLISHGYGKAATIHNIIRNNLYFENHQQFYESVIKYLSTNNIDIILAPGNIISALTWNLQRLKHKSKICALLSSTGEKTNTNELNYLSNNGIIKSWCDHMRCWDGGVTFFTCRYHTAHLIDGLAWAATDNEHRLISDDYYSLASPFVNYWNGDYATIGTDFEKCRFTWINVKFCNRRTT